MVRDNTNPDTSIEEVDTIVVNDLYMAIFVKFNWQSLFFRVQSSEWGMEIDHLPTLSELTRWSDILGKVEVFTKVALASDTETSFRSQSFMTASLWRHVTSPLVTSALSATSGGAGGRRLRLLSPTSHNGRLSCAVRDEWWLLGFKASTSGS